MQLIITDSDEMRGSPEYKIHEGRSWRPSDNNTLGNKRMRLYLRYSRYCALEKKLRDSYTLIAGVHPSVYSNQRMCVFLCG